MLQWLFYLKHFNLRVSPIQPASMTPASCSRYWGTSALHPQDNHLAWHGQASEPMGCLLFKLDEKKFFVAVGITKNIPSIYQITVFQQSQVVQDFSCWLSSTCWNICNGRWLEDILWKSVWKGKSQRCSPNSCWGCQDMKPWYVKVKVRTKLFLFRKPGRFQLLFFNWWACSGKLFRVNHIIIWYIIWLVVSTHLKDVIVKSSPNPGEHKIWNHLVIYISPTWKSIGTTTNSQVLKSRNLGTSCDSAPESSDKNGCFNQVCWTQPPSAGLFLVLFLVGFRLLRKTASATSNFQVDKHSERDRSYYSPPVAQIANDDF